MKELNSTRPQPPYKIRKQGFCVAKKFDLKKSFSEFYIDIAFKKFVSNLLN